MAILSRILGGGIAEDVKTVAGAFQPNAEASDARESDLVRGAQSELAAEFGAAPTGVLGRVADGLNRLVRPVLALGTLAVFGDAWRDPDGFAATMDAYARVPPALWQTLVAVVTLYTGSRIHARHVAHAIVRHGRAKPPERPHTVTR